MTDAIERLEKWKSKHKARHCYINIDDGYGASCWVVELYHEKGVTRGYEALFISNAELGEEGTIKQLRERGIGFPKEENDDWAGLSKTIHCAIDVFEEGKYEEWKRPHLSDQELQKKIISLELELKTLKEKYNLN